MAHCSESIPDETVAAAKHTQHKWGFMKKLSDKDKDALASTANSVKVTTANAADLGSSANAGSTAVRAASSSGATSARATVAPRRETPDEYDDRQAGVQQRRSGLKQQNSALLDEIAPRETGRAAAIDKRKTISATMHGAARVKTQNLMLNDTYANTASNARCSIHHCMLSQILVARFPFSRALCHKYCTEISREHNLKRSISHTIELM
jgi:hypothetical protein